MHKFLAPLAAAAVAAIVGLTTGTASVALAGYSWDGAPHRILAGYSWDGAAHRGPVGV